jgi:hypothetical protein
MCLCLYSTRHLTEPREAGGVLRAVGLSSVTDLTAPWPGGTEEVDITATEADYQAFYHNLSASLAQLSVQRTLCFFLPRSMGIEVIR